MRIVKDGDTTKVYIRQSWLKDAMMCNERGRYNMLPDYKGWSKPNELSAIGTSVHAAIEHDLTNLNVPIDEAIDVGLTTFERISTDTAEPMRWVKYNDSQSRHYVEALYRKWAEFIRPQVRGQIIGVEQPFEFPLYSTSILDGERIDVYGEGTIDLITTEQLWDWKTASRKYNEKEKQESDVQSMMYVAAAAEMGLTSLPAKFNFGVMVRGGATQIVTVDRDKSHIMWLNRIIRPLVRQALTIGTEDSWTVNDTHFLCNSTWCPFWSVCRGAYQS